MNYALIYLPEVG